MPDTKQTTRLSFDNEQAVLDAALAIMGKRLGRPCGFRPLLTPGETSVEVVSKPPSGDDKGGYISAVKTCGPLPGGAHEGHRDLPDGDYTRRCLDEVIEAIRDEIGAHLT